MQKQNWRNEQWWKQHQFGMRRALSRVIEYELKQPGRFGQWLTDLHIEHWAAFKEKYKEQANARS